MNIYQKAAELTASHTPFALATIISSQGSTPRSKAKMIILQDGSCFGTVGGGLAESSVIEEAKLCIRYDRSKLLSYSLDREAKTDALEMDCGGSMEIFIESVSPGPRLLLIGGGHVSLEIARAAGQAGFRIAVVETRPEFCSEERFPTAERYLDGDLNRAMAAAPLDGKTFIVIATSSSDDRALRYYLDKDAAYIGMLGSRRKVKLLKQRLIDEGASCTRLEWIHAPIGLDLGAETPAEIAVSVLSELLAVKNGRQAQSLSSDRENRVVVRGAGDIASGTICRLVKAGFEVIALESEKPTVIRRTVSFAQAIFDGRMELEGVIGRRAESLREIRQILAEGDVPIVPDPRGEFIAPLKPCAVVDGILAKKNLGTTRSMAPATIGLGPGFEAGSDVDAVIETMRGHHLGRVILDGKAMKNSGVPGLIAGYSKERVIRAPKGGECRELVSIGDLVHKGDPVLSIIDEKGTNTQVESPLDGMIRGLIRSGTVVAPGFKIGDVDPRGEEADYTSVSDKARAVAGGVLEALLYLLSRRKK